MDLKRIDPNGGGMTLHQKGDCRWVSFPKLDREEWALNAFSTRFGGVSTGCFSSMNLGFSREPGSPNVAQNYRIFADAVGFSPEDTVFTQQEHTDHIIRVGREHRGFGFSRPRPWTEIDGLITNEPGVVLTIFGADCVPIFLLDPQNRAIAAVHSGWRGTVKGIAGKAVHMMQEEFGSDPAKLIAGIGPSICRDCYEVSSDVALQFPEECRREKGGDKYLLDLHRANRLILMEAGLAPRNIESGNVCTNCNPDVFFSHRASKGHRGVCAGFLEIR